ncbi:MAG: class I SAM-dependent methyltransferase, partial [Rhodococcus sp. (in: high G+C Gram-positive bacteria)]
RQRRSSLRYRPLMGVDSRATSGFRAVAEDYETGRPTYADVSIDRIFTDLELSISSRVLDLAAGTGQLSRMFRSRVGSVVAVEPVHGMRERIKTTTPGITVLDGTAESIPLPDSDVDAVVVGEAFHWFETATATSEIARVLKPSGGLGLLWNTPIWTVDTTPWLQDLRRILSHHKESAGEYPAGVTWQKALESTRLFETLQHTNATHEQSLGHDAFLAQVASWSWVANLPEAARRTALNEVAELVRPLGRIVIPYRTDLYVGRRQSAPIHDVRP